LAYQLAANSIFLSEQISQQPASSTFLSEQTSTSHQPPAKRTGKGHGHNAFFTSKKIRLFFSSKLYINVSAFIWSDLQICHDKLDAPLPPAMLSFQLSASSRLPGRSITSHGWTTAPVKDMLPALQFFSLQSPFILPQIPPSTFLASLAGRSTSGAGCRPAGRCPGERRGGEQGPDGGSPRNDELPAGSGWAGPRRPPPRSCRTARAAPRRPWPLGQQKNLTTKFFYFFFLAIFKYFLLHFLKILSQNVFKKLFLILSRIFM
jgi:hypothetical protein